MTRRRAVGGGIGAGVRRWVVSAAILVAAAAAQQPGAVEAPPPAAWRIEYSYFERRVEDDATVWYVTRGVALRRGSSQIFAREAIIQEDVDAAREAMRQEPSDLPRRGAPGPDRRRVADEAELERRMASFLAATGKGPPPRADVAAPTGREVLVGLVRTMYLEGDVVVLHEGVETLRARSLFLSAVDDRMVMHDVELRLPNRDPDTGLRRLVILRGARLVRQGPRITGRDISITTSIAAEPHFEFVAGEVELIERGDEFEVRGRDNRLLVHGSKISALPDMDFFTSQEPPFPLKGVSGGYANKEGAQAKVQLGGNWNQLGGSLHQALTGDDASEFRGKWRASVGFNQERGIPLEGELDYRGGEVYRGRTRGFFLDDQGNDRGPVQLDLDNGFIRESRREMVRSQNRVSLGEATTLDAELFQVSDPAVYPEFFQGDWMESELPETRMHLRHARDNWIATLSGRFDINGVAYRDDRTLAQGFLEERPYGTFDLFSQPLFDVAERVPVLLTASTRAGQLRFNADRLATTTDMEALRLDQELELAVPFAVGVVTVRPFVFGRVTYYDDSPNGDDVARWSYGGGVRAGTRLQRTWTWLDDGVETSLRHVMNPEIAVLHRTRVSKDPADVFQFDDIDALDEDVTIRVGLLNRWQTHRRRVARDSRDQGADAVEVEEPIWLDLAQNFKPNRNRDNEGEFIGLTEYELILRPGLDWPLPNLRLFVEGEYDTKRHDNRTFNVGTRFGKVLGVDWSVEYREDALRDGVLIGGGGATVWTRWDVAAGSSYDLDRKETLNYFASLSRRDLDWTMRLGLIYNNLRGETSFFIRFEPTLGGFASPLNREFDRGQRSLTSSLEGY
ncbi:MAG: hypothetical protein R3F56_22465 [Planctomycetota bacterium]